MTRGSAGGGVRLWRANFFWAAEPELAHRGGLAPSQFHLTVVKLPEDSILEEVGLPVRVLEDGMDVAGHPLPHAHVPGIVQFDKFRILVELPVHGTWTGRA